MDDFTNWLIREKEYWSPDHTFQEMENGLTIVDLKKEEHFFSIWEPSIYGQLKGKFKDSDYLHAYVLKKSFTSYFLDFSLYDVEYRIILYVLGNNHFELNFCLKKKKESDYDYHHSIYEKFNNEVLLNLYNKVNLFKSVIFTLPTYRLKKLFNPLEIYKSGFEQHVEKVCELNTGS